MKVRLYVDPRIAPRARGGADARAQGHRLRARRPAARWSAACVMRLARLPRRPRAGAEGRRAQGAGLARRLARARRAAARSAAVPGRPGAPRRGRGGRAVGRRGTSRRSRARSRWWALKRRKSDQASFLDAGYGRLGMPTRVAGRDLAAARPHGDPAERLDRRDRARSRSRRSRPALDQVDGLDRRGRDRAASSRTRPTSRSRRRLRLLMAFDDIEPRDRGPPGSRPRTAHRPRIRRADRPRVPAGVARAAAARPLARRPHRLSRSELKDSGARRQTIARRADDRSLNGPWSSRPRSSGTRSPPRRRSAAGWATCGERRSMPPSRHRVGPAGRRAA